LTGQKLFWLLLKVCQPEQKHFQPEQNVCQQQKKL